jgi:hypothetical protein
MLTKRPLPDEIQIPRPLPDPEFVQAIDKQMWATLSDPAQLALTANRKPISMNPTNRSLGTIYQNTNNYPIVVMLQANNAPPGNPAFGNSCALFGYIDERLVSVSVSAGFGPGCQLDLNVYPNLKYKVEASPKTVINSWTEVR